MNELVGLLLPPLIDLINTKVPNTNIRFIISLVICTVVGVVLNLQDLKYHNTDDIVKSIAVVFTAAQLTYKLYWERSQVRAKMASKLT